jgi:hypothetical protein
MGQYIGWGLDTCRMGFDTGWGAIQDGTAYRMGAIQNEWSGMQDGAGDRMARVQEGA